MDNIKDIVHQVVGKMASRMPETQEKLERVWISALQKDEIKHVKIVGIKDGKLMVHVDAPSWLYQMSIRKQKILYQLKEDCPEVKTISFKIGKVT